LWGVGGPVGGRENTRNTDKKEKRYVTTQIDGDSRHIEIVNNSSVGSRELREYRIAVFVLIFKN
jgi:hypothetical protein